MERHATTDRDFIRRDLAEESERVRQLNRERDKEKEKEHSSILAITPKKRKNHPHGDGFENDEVKISSPSKLSPSKNQKRCAGSPPASRRQRRKVICSPSGRLDISASQTTVAPENNHWSNLKYGLIQTNLPIWDVKIDVGSCPSIFDTLLLIP